MTKPVTALTTFSGLAPPWQLAQLDANIAALQTAVNDLGTYSNPLVDVSGSANAITVNAAAGLTASYAFGLLLYIKVANTTTSTTVTINLDSLGNVSVVSPGGGGPAAGAFVAGGVYPFIHDGTNFQAVTQSFASLLASNNTWSGFNNFNDIVVAAGLAVTNSSSSISGTAEGLLVGVGAPGTQTLNQSYVGLNVGFNGTNYITGTDGASNGGVLFLGNYNPAAVSVVLIPSTGGTSQVIAPGSLPTPMFSIAATGISSNGLVQSLGGTFPGVTASSANLVAGSNNAQVYLINASAAANNRFWAVSNTIGGTFAIFAANDADTVGNAALQITRSGATPTGISGWGPVAAAQVDMTPDKGSWTTTASGPFSGSGTLKWERQGTQVTVWADANITGTSGTAASLTFSALPASITPSSQRAVSCSFAVVAATNLVKGTVTVNTNNTLVVSLDGFTTPFVTTGNTFPSSGTVGIFAGWSINYSL